MLRYIHQFVQTFLREASKSRPQSRKASRSRIDIGKDKSTVKPEMLGIDFNNERPDTEHSKEILELKRTYSLLMKKFANPNLDLMTSTRKSSDIDILSLKGKQELIRSLLNKIFFDKIDKQTKLENSAEVLPEANLITNQEELSIGWSGQQTSKLAANPMVETSSKSNNIASAMFSFPKVQEEHSNMSVKKSDKHELKSMNVKYRKTESNKPFELTKQTKLDHMLASDATKINLNTEMLKETESKEYVICSGNMKSGFKLSDISRDQPTLDKDTNGYSGINNKSLNPYIERKDFTKYNKKENMNIIQSIAKVDKSEISQTNDTPSSKLNSSKRIISKSTNINKNKIAQNKTDKRKTTVREKSSFDQENLSCQMVKNKESMNNKKQKGKSEQSAGLSTKPKGLLSDSHPTNLNLLPDKKPHNTSDGAVENACENINPITLKSTTSEVKNDDVGLVMEENLLKPKFATLAREENHKSSEMPTTVEYVAGDQVCSPNKDQAEIIDEKLNNETVNEKSKSNEVTYWNHLSNKLMKTASDTKTFINNFEINDWKAKNYLRSVPNTLELTNVNSKNEGSQPSESGTKDPITTEETFNSLKNTKINKSCSDICYKIANIDKYNARQTNSDISHESASNNVTQSKETDLKSTGTSKSMEDIFTAKNTDTWKLDEVEEIPKPEIISITKTTTIPEGDNKVKKLLRQLKKTHKNKSKHNLGTVQRMYSKVINENKFKKTPLHKFQVNKETNLASKLRRAVRTKSDPLSTDKTKTSSIPTALEPHSLPTIVSNTYTFDKKKNEVMKSENKLQITSPRIPNDTERKININIVNSNIFPGDSIKKYKYRTNTPPLARKTVKGENEYNANHNTAKIITESTTVKTRKLHSRKQFFKPAKLQMYGARRSIYTHSTPKATLSPNKFKSCMSEHVIEPNISSRSLIYVCGISLNKQTNTNPVTKQIRSLHSTGFIGKVKQLPRKKKTVVMKENGKAKSENVNSEMCCVADETTSKETKLKGGNTYPIAKSLNKTCLYNSPNGETLVKNSVMKQENGSTHAANDKNYALRGTKFTSGSSSLPSSMKTKGDDANQINFSKSELQVDNHLTPATYCKEDTYIDSNVTSTGTQREIENIKINYLGIKLDLQNIQSSQGNEEVIETPKWKSKEDRLEKWKSEVESNRTIENAKDAVVKACEGLENDSCHSQSQGKKLEDKNLPLEKEGSQKKLIVTNTTKSNVPSIVTNTIKSNVPNTLRILFDNTEKKCLQKDDKTREKCDGEEKQVKEKNESNKLSKDVDNILLLNPSKNSLIQNQTNNNVTISRKTSTNELSETKDTSGKKIKEFESKLRLLESKLRVLELKSTEENKYESSLKSDVNKHTNFMAVPLSTNHIITDDKNTGIREGITNSPLVGMNGLAQSKVAVANTASSESKGIKNNKNDSMRNYLSKKVKTLELKLQSLETKVKDLKETPSDSTKNNKNLMKMPLWSKSSVPVQEIRTQNLAKPKLILEASKLDQILTLHSENRSKIDGINVPNKINTEDHEREKYNTSSVFDSKPETYLKKYLSKNEKGLDDQIKLSCDSNIANDKKSSNNKNCLPNNQSKIKDNLKSSPPSIVKENNFTQNLVKSVENAPEKVQKQKPQPKCNTSERICVTRKVPSNDTNKTNKQTNIYSKQKLDFTQITGISRGKKLNVRRIREDNQVQKYVNQKQKIGHISALDNNIPKSMALKENELVKLLASTSTPQVQKELNKGASVLMNSPIDCNRSINDSGVRDSKIVTKRSKSKAIPSNLDKRSFIKRNLYQPKKSPNRLNSGINIKEKHNMFLHEGLKNTMGLKSADSKHSENLNAKDKGYPSSEIKFVTSIQSPVLPKKISKAIRRLKSPHKKQELKESVVEPKYYSRLDSTGFCKFIKDSTSEGSTKQEKLKKTFNSFDFYKPKRRSYEMKHPIEKEKCGIEFIKQNEDILSKFLPKNHSQNCTQYGYLLKKNKIGKESKNSNSGSEKHLNNLMFNKNSLPTAKSIQK